MKINYIYPGTFCPPHFGHVALAKEAAAVFGHVAVICSTNPVKEEKIIFTPDECRQMWQTYGLGENIEVVTLEEFLKTRDPRDLVVMIRGIRDNNDIIFENDVMIYNRDNFGVNHYHYIIGAKEFRGFSSSLARRAAKSGDWGKLNELVNPQVAAKMKEKFGASNR